MSTNSQKYKRYMQNRQKQSNHIKFRNHIRDKNRNSKRFSPYNTSSSMKNDVKNSSSNVDVRNLIQNLIGKGMIPHSSTDPGEKMEVLKTQESKESGLIKPIVLSSFHPSLKLRQQEIIDQLYGPNPHQEKEVENNPELFIEKMETNSMALNESDQYIKPIVLSSFHPSLRLRQQRIIDQLYDLKAYQCSNCGLRFPKNDPKEIQDHKDWHFKVNMDQRKWKASNSNSIRISNRISESRVWFQDKSSWLNDNYGQPNQTNTELTEPNLANMVPKSSNPKENICPVCNEDFKEITVEEETLNKKNKMFDVYEEIYLLNAVRPHGLGTNAYHPLCYDDANKQRLCLMSTLLRPFLKN